MTGPKRILVVDDEYSSTEVLAFVLGDEGYHVTTACNGRQALDRLEKAAPDLVVTDYMMPVMNGIELAKAVRAMPRYASVPFVLMTGVPEAGLAAHRAHFERFLRKPFDMDALLATVRALLR